MLKFFEIDARFPRHRGEVPAAAVDFVAAQLEVEPQTFVDYKFSGRTHEYHRGQIRRELSFRAFTLADEDKLIDWLAGEVCPSELNCDRQREAVLARCRGERIEPPALMDRIIGAANRAADRRFCITIVTRLPEEVQERLLRIVKGTSDGEGRFFAELKADPGRVRAVGLPEDLFADTAEARIVRWRSRGGRRLSLDAAARPTGDLMNGASGGWLVRLQDFGVGAAVDHAEFDADGEH